MKGLALKQIRQLGPQLLMAFAVGMLASVWGNPWTEGIVFGICTAIAAYLGLHTLAAESDEQLRFVCALPLSRRQIVGTKLAVHFVLLQIFWSVSMVASSQVFAAVGFSSDWDGPFYMFSAIGIPQSALIFCITFALFGFTSCVFRKPSNAAFVGLVFGMVGYPIVWYLLYTVLNSILGSPEPQVLTAGRYPAIWVVSTVIPVAMLGVAFWTFGRYPVLEHRRRIIATGLLAMLAFIIGFAAGLARVLI